MAFELEAHFGDEAAREFRAAMRSRPAFAQRTRCPAGDDVIQWFAAKNSELQAAAREDFEADRRALSEQGKSDA